MLVDISPMPYIDLWYRFRTQPAVKHLLGRARIMMLDDRLNSIVHRQFPRGYCDRLLSRVARFASSFRVASSGDSS
jgi:hypothetical protein